MACRGICVRYKIGKPSTGQGRYATGQKRCQICEIFIQCDGLICPCCSYRLRLKPRNMKSKIKLLNDKSMQIKLLNDKSMQIKLLNDKSMQIKPMTPAISMLTS